MSDTRKRSTKTYNPETGKEGLGQNGLYWKMLRMIAHKIKEGGEKKSISKIIDHLHDVFQLSFNYREPFPDFPQFREPKGTHDLTVPEFHAYYSKCQEASIRQWGISGMEEDSRPFDHGGK